MFDFKEKFKDRPTIELLQMLEHPEKYQPGAIAAAKEIIESWKHENYAEWENEVASLQLAKEEARKKKAIKQKKNAAYDANGIWIKDEKEIQNDHIARNQIISIGIVLAFVSLLSLFYFLRILFYESPEIKDIFNLYALTTIGPEILGLTGLIFFYKKEKTGWIILTAIFTYRLSFKMVILVNGINMLTMPYNKFFSPGMLFMPIIQIGLFSIILYQMNTLRIRKVYHATRKEFITTVLITAFLCGCFIFGVYSSY